jgi:hypothetical protein
MIPAERVELLFEASRPCNVVGIHAGNELATGVLESGIQRIDNAAATVAYEADARLPFEDPCRFVRRVIVDGNDLDVVVRLALQRVQTLFEERCRIPDGKQDRNHRRRIA